MVSIDLQVFFVLRHFHSKAIQHFCFNLTFSLSSHHSSFFPSDRLECLIDSQQITMDVESIDDIEKRRIEEAERAALLLSDRAIVAQRDLFRLTNEHNGFVPVFFFFSPPQPHNSPHQH